MDANFEFIQSLPGKDHFLSMDGAKDLDRVFDWIVKYATACYGMKDIRKNLRNNPGMMLIKLITTSDMAYVEAVMEDSREH